jgi:hypothetical protein
MDWNDKITVKKGNIGERLVDEYLLARGYIPYRPVEGYAHPFDRLCASPDKRTIFVADAKAKPARKYYPDTGINIKTFNEYKYIQDKYNIDVFLFFVDEDAMRIYGEFLRVLEKPRRIEHNGKELRYPLMQPPIIYFPLSIMRNIAPIKPDDVAMLKHYSTRSLDYRVLE